MPKSGWCAGEPKSAHVGADGEEGDVAEVEQPGQADHDVQPEGGAAKMPTWADTRIQKALPCWVNGNATAAAATRHRDPLVAAGTGR